MPGWPVQPGGRRHDRDGALEERRDEVCAHLRRELAHLETAERRGLLAGTCVRDGWDAADQAERHAGELELAHMDRRIDRLRARLSALEEAPPPSLDGLAIGTMW